MTIPTLQKQASPLAVAARQVAILESLPEDAFPRFDQSLAANRLPTLQADRVEVLQVNLGRVCNQTCGHCHVDAGPDRREAMDAQIADACLRVLGEFSIPTLDITGGAPEMNENFRRLAAEASRMGRRVIDRCNLTILLAPRYEYLPEFLAEHGVEVVASLPCYLEDNCDRQRGDGVFRKSIEAIGRLNALGYGIEGSNLKLSLVYNPVGAALPPAQDALEATYRRELRERYGIEFTRLYTITNLPISRFLSDLLSSGRYEQYMRTLIEAFNPATVDALMCRTTLSVDWQGWIYDCDFNQMLGLGVAGSPLNVRDLDRLAMDALERRRIVTGRHCYGCSAGSGSSCQGSLQA